MSASENRAFKRRPDQQYPEMMERRPRRLKDFLTADDSSCTSNSCSSSAFNSVPRRRHQLYSPPPPLRRSRSRAAASSTISALQAVISAVKRFHSLKSPAAILPRSLSRRRSKKEDRSHEPKKLTVTIKDIIRWRSFRDLAEDESPAPLVFDSPPPPRECTAASLSSSTATSSTPCSSSGSSWCDSDFTAEELPCWDGNSHNSGKKFYGVVGAGELEDEMRKSTVQLKVGPEDEEVGYHEFEEEEEEDSAAASCRLKQKHLGKAGESEIRGSKQKVKKQQQVAKWEEDLENLMAAAAGEEEEEEEDSEVKERMAMAMAMQLVEHIKATTSVAGFCFDELLLGFFTEALSSRSSNQLLGFGVGELNEMIQEAESWIINGQQGKSSSCGGLPLEDRSSSGSWIKFREEEEEEAVGIQTWITNLLLHEILDDLFFIIPSL